MTDIESFSILAVIGLVLLIFLVAGAVAIFSIIVTWKVYEKANKPGWASLIPFYNNYILDEMTWGNGWLFLLSLSAVVPFVGSSVAIVMHVLTSIKLAKAFGKSTGFAFGLIFLNIIFMAILAFGDSTYLGPEEN